MKITNKVRREETDQKEKRIYNLAVPKLHVNNFQSSGELLLLLLTKRRFIFLTQRHNLQ